MGLRLIQKLKHRREPSITAFELSPITGSSGLPDAWNMLHCGEIFDPADVLNAARESDHVQLVVEVYGFKVEDERLKNIQKHLEDQTARFFGAMAVPGETFDVSCAKIDICSNTVYRIDIYRTVTITTRPTTVERI